MKSIKVHLLLDWKLRVQTSCTTSLYGLKFYCFPQPLQVNCEILRQNGTKLNYFQTLTICNSPAILSFWEHVVKQFLEELRYKPEGSGFDSRWCYWHFLLI